MDFTKDLTTDLTTDELTAIGEAMQVGARLKKALSSLRAAMEKRDKQAALDALDEALATLEGYGYAYGYPSPAEDDNGELMVGMEAKDIKASLEAARKAIDDNDWEAAMKAVEELLKSYGYTLTNDMMETNGPKDKARLSESSFGYAVDFTERERPDGPAYIDLVPLQPGWGNSRDNHYYPADVVKEFANVWLGAKMWATDHKQEDKNALNQISEVVLAPAGYTEDGVPFVRAVILNPEFEEVVRRRKRAGILNSLYCSIIAAGTVHKESFKKNGRTGKRVRSINDDAGIDWVTKAGAGGHAKDFSEGAMMDKEEKEKQEEVQEAEFCEDGLSKIEIEAKLNKSNLPAASCKRLAEGLYKDDTELDSAIQAEKDYVGVLTRSGKPVGMGMTEQPNEQTLKELEKTKAARFERIMREVGLRR